MVRTVRMVWVCSSFLALLSCVHGIGGPINTVAAADSPNVIIIFVDVLYGFADGTRCP